MEVSIRANKPVRLLLVLTLLLFPKVASCAWVDGNELKEWCSNKSSGYERGACFGYLTASSSAFMEENYCDTGTFYRVLGSYDDPCLTTKYKVDKPENVRISQRKSVVLKYLQDNPGRLHNSGKSLVAEAMIDAFGWKVVVDK